MTTTQPRIRCEVPGCRRTRVPNSAWPAEWQWWLCGVHWPMVSKATKRVLARYRRQEAKFGRHIRPAGYHRICQRVFREAGALVDQQQSAPAVSGEAQGDVR